MERVYLKKDIIYIYINYMSNHTLNEPLLYPNYIEYVDWNWEYEEMGEELETKVKESNLKAPLCSCVKFIINFFQDWFKPKS